MNTLSEAIDHYLLLRRNLGFKLIQADGWLHDFAAFMEQQQAAVITLELALQWAVQPQHAQPSTWGRRLATIRRFARYHSNLDPRTEIPPSGLLSHKSQRAKPYPYTDEEVARLMQAAKTLPPPHGLRAQSYYCLLGLLAVTGLRIGEALALKREDVDLPAGLLMIRGAKFDKSRWVPLHRSTQDALLAYAEQRDRTLGRTTTECFFVSEQGNPLAASSVRRTFRALCREIGLHGTADCDEPRLHHFRHRFATETLLQWYRSHQDIERKLPVLATFLGHTHVSHTYWYLSARPALMAQAVKRLEHFWEKI
ncbi:MAG: tyrosine-type recombinase/integrase [Methyloligellaceae bacterium]